MTLPPETPQDYCDYFEQFLNATPPSPKWGIGLKASQMWRDYCEQGDRERNGQNLIHIIKILMPVSNSSSMLVGLWLQILGHIAQLPVSEQKETWLEVFNVKNQGENITKHNEQAYRILEEWVKLDNYEDKIQINENILTDMANKIYTYTFSGREWIAFTVAIDKWFKKYIEEPSLYDLVCVKFEKKAS